MQVLHTFLQYCTAYSGGITPSMLCGAMLQLTSRMRNRATQMSRDTVANEVLRLILTV